MKKVIITGANGFIGSHLAEHFSSKKFKVIAVVNKKNSFIESLPVETFLADITQKNCIRSFSNVDVFYHLASLTEIGKFKEDLEYGMKVNVEGTKNAVECAKDFSKKFVFASTFGVYGDSKELPIRETCKLSPLEPYALSKAMGEKITEDMCSKHNLNFSIARIFSCYGERQKQNSLIPSIISQCLSSDQITAGNTKPTRDFIYVKDAVSALESLGKEKNKGIYNIGTGTETSIGDLISKIIMLSGQKKEVKKDASKFKEKSIEVLRSRADISRIKSIGWSPKVLLMDGLKFTYSFYQNENLRRN